MRHPFWTWTSWLSLGLAGCLHGFEGRQVSTHSVSEQRDSSRPVVAGPFRKAATTFAPPTGTNDLHAAPRASSAPTNSATAEKKPLPRKVDVFAAVPSPTVRDSSAPRRDGQVIPAQFPPPPPAPPAEPPAPTTPPQKLNASQTQQPNRSQPQRLNTAHRALPLSVPASPTPTPATSRPQPQPFAEFERAIPLRPGSDVPQQKPDTDDDDAIFLPRS